MILDTHRLVIRPGSGIAARFPSVVLLVTQFLPEQESIVRRMVEHAREASAAPQPGRTLARLLAGLLVGPDGDNVPSFASLGAIGDDIAIMVYGDAEVQSAGTVGSVRISGTEAAAWVDRIIGGNFESLMLTANEAEAIEADALHELGYGVVPASGVLLTSASSGPASPVAAPPQASSREPALAASSEPAAQEPDTAAHSRASEAPEATAPEPPEPEEPVFVALTGQTQAEAALSVAPPTGTVTFADVSDAEKREPLPVIEQPEDIDAAAQEAPEEVVSKPGAVLVKGVRCKNGHFNHPRALYCVYDGSAMVDVTRIEVDGPRPSLGVLVFDDGSAYSLESPYVIGRRPQAHPALDSGEALPLVVPDSDEQVSRNHLHLDLVGWDVVITDLGSRNGTFLTVPGHPEGQPIAPNVTQPLESGTRVRIGGRSFVFESHHRK